MNKDEMLLSLIKKEQCCSLDSYELQLKHDLESGEFKDDLDIITDWLDCILDEDEINSLLNDIRELDEKDFGDIINLVNECLGHDNADGEFDGVAMELEEYYGEYWE